MLYRTTNKGYNDIAKIVNDKRVSNEDTCKKQTEMEEAMDIGQKIATWSFNEDIPAVGTEENICLLQSFVIKLKLTVLVRLKY